MDRFEEEIQTVRDIYNDAGADNWGFVLMTERELQPLLSGKPGNPGRNADNNRRFLNAGLGVLPRNRENRMRTERMDRPQS